MNTWFGKEIPKLGFGTMRLPTLADNAIDYAQIEKMVDLFLENGFTYFDTAYGYMGGRSEDTVRRTLVERHARERFLLATKLPPWELKAKEDMERVLQTQLARTGAAYFDFYMLHSIGQTRLEQLDSLGAWDFLQKAKERGLVRHVGFSFHDTADVLDGILKRHPETEFVQLQINYADWDDEGVQSRLCYETALSHGKSVLIMEPVKGGALATLNETARAPFERARPGMSNASWAMRFAASLPGVITVLSGMSTLAQMEDNIRTMSAFEPLTEADRKAIDEVKAVLSAIPTTPCTDCRYCVEKCPQNIPIPSVIQADNHRKVYGHVNRGHYRFVTNEKGKASDCIACGVCEERCPQHIGIISLMKECAEVFE